MTAVQGVLSEDCFSDLRAESDHDGTLLSPTTRGQEGPDGGSGLGPPGGVIFGLDRQTWPLQIRHPGAPLLRGLGGETSLSRSKVGLAQSAQGHAKGMPTYPNGFTPGLTRAFSELNPSDCHVWEIEES